MPGPAGCLRRARDQRQPSAYNERAFSHMSHQEHGSSGVCSSGAARHTRAVAAMRPFPWQQRDHSRGHLQRRAAATGQERAAGFVSLARCLPMPRTSGCQGGGNFSPCPLCIPSQHSLWTSTPVQTEQALTHPPAATKRWCHSCGDQPGLQEQRQHGCGAACRPPVVERLLLPHNGRGALGGRKANVLGRLCVE
jgi:hypothetical protein